MSTNYQLGADFERRVGGSLSAEGYEVFRSAGSRGKVDILAIKTGQLLLIQCKRDGQISREDWNDLVQLRQRLDPRGGTALALLAFMPGARGIAYRELLNQLEHNERRRLAYRAWEPDQIGAVRDDVDGEAGRVAGSPGPES